MHLPKNDMLELIKHPIRTRDKIRDKIEIKILNTKTDLDRKAYNNQTNYVVSLLRK